MRYLSVRYENKDYQELNVLAVLLQTSISEITRQSIEDFKVKNYDSYCQAVEIVEKQNTLIKLDVNSSYGSITDGSLFIPTA
jgi:hypothetical protein